MNNIGIVCNTLNILDDINQNLPNNTYLIYCINKNVKDIKNIIEFLIRNDCKTICLLNSNKNLNDFKKTFKKIKIQNSLNNIKENKNSKKIILLNESSNKIKNNSDIIDYYKINTTRKDSNPKDTVFKIKNILKENNYKVKEKYKKRNLNGIYSLRLELNDNKGSNGKGITLNLARASAYAELMERLQSNMLYKKRISTPVVNKNKELYMPLLNNADAKYKEKFFELDDLYFNTEKLLNIKSGIYEEVPLNAVNCFCHTNGLASGNSFSEAVSQAIFEILERYSYQNLLNSNIEIKNIDISKFPLNKSNKKTLKKLEKLGYKYFIKDCSLGKYPTLGFLLFNTDMTKYTFTIASDYSLNIALSRCITEMMQGLRLKDLNNKMLEKLDLTDLDKKYKKNYKSYNWLKCFNNNIGYLPKGFFCTEFVELDKLHFKEFFTNNDDVLEQLKKDIEYNIYIKDYNVLGFDTYRVYIPYLTEVDCYDIDDLTINKNYNNLKNIYLNITTTAKEEIKYFVDTFLEINKNIKYDELIKPSDLFHIEESSDYYKLDFTSLLIVLALLVNKESELCNLLEYKINNFKLSSIKDTTYKIIINVINNKCIYNISNKNIEQYIKNIIQNTENYLILLNPQQQTNSLITNKKV